MREIEIPISRTLFRELLSKMRQDLRFTVDWALSPDPIALVFYGGKLIPGFDVYLTVKR